METLLTEVEERRYAELQRMALGLAREGETEVLRSMVEAGMPVNLSDAKGNSLLMLAAYHDHLGAARMLLEHGADVDRRNDHGQTPLGGAAFKGYREIAALLLEHGADIDADNGMGMTPIMFAAVFGRARIVDQLRAHGAALDRRNRLGLSARTIVALGSFFRRVVDGVRHWRRRCPAK